MEVDVGRYVDLERLTPLALARLVAVPSVGANAAQTLFDPSRRPPVAHDRIGDGNRVARGRNVVHANDVDAGAHRKRGRRDGSVDAVAGGSRPVSLPIVDLRDVPSIVGKPSATTRSQRAKHGEVLIGRFSEADAGIEHDAFARDAARRRARAHSASR